MKTIPEDERVRCPACKCWNHLTDQQSRLRKELLARCRDSIFTRGTCESCSIIFCIVCDTQWQRNHSCIQIRSQRGKPDADRLAIEAIRRAGGKHCPRCEAPVIKDGGCNHMIHHGCTSGVNTHFCYCCGLELNSQNHRKDVNGRDHFPSGVYKDCINKSSSSSSSES